MKNKTQVNWCLFLSGGMLLYLAIPLDTMLSIVACGVAGATLGTGVAKLICGN